MGLKLLMLGDIVGRAGRRVVQQQLPRLRADYDVDLVVANAENAAGGSGLTPSMFSKLIKYGIDGVTLGDHVFRQVDIVASLRDEPNICRPANLPERAEGATWMKLTTRDGGRSLYVMTVLGRLFMNGPLADDPFATVDLILQELEEDVPVLVEIHAEATSEKHAMGRYLDGRVAAVLGTHTHVPTADARILPRGTAFITDLGMSGPYESILGRRIEPVVAHMTTGMPHPFGVAEDDARLCGVYIELDGTRAKTIERIEVPADTTRPPFVGD